MWNDFHGFDSNGWAFSCEGGGNYQVEHNTIKEDGKVSGRSCYSRQAKDIMNGDEIKVVFRRGVVTFYHNNVKVKDNNNTAIGFNLPPNKKFALALTIAKGDAVSLL